MLPIKQPVFNVQEVNDILEYLKENKEPIYFSIVDRIGDNKQLQSFEDVIISRVYIAKKKIDDVKHEFLMFCIDKNTFFVEDIVELKSGEFYLKKKESLNNQDYLAWQVKEYKHVLTDKEESDNKADEDIRKLKSYERRTYFGDAADYLYSTKGSGIFWGKKQLTKNALKTRNVVSDFSLMSIFGVWTIVKVVPGALMLLPHAAMFAGSIVFDVFESRKDFNKSEKSKGTWRLVDKIEERPAETKDLKTRRSKVSKK